MKLKRREGELVEPSSKIVSRRTNTPQGSIVMEHEGGLEEMSEDERNFRKQLFEMSEMVKDLYEERNFRLQEESSKPPRGKGDKPPKWNGGNGDKPPPSPPSSPSSSTLSYTTSSLSKTPPTSLMVHGKTPFLKIDIQFEFPIYNGEVNAKKLDNWICQIEVYCRMQRNKMMKPRFSFLLLYWKEQHVFGGKLKLKRT